MSDGYAGEVVRRILGCDEEGLFDLEERGLLLGVTAEGTRYYHAADVQRLAGERDLSDYEIQYNLDSLPLSALDLHLIFRRECDWVHVEPVLDRLLGPDREAGFVWSSVTDETAAHNLEHAIAEFRRALDDLNDFQGNGAKLRAAVRAIRIRNRKAPADQSIGLLDGILDASWCLSEPEECLAEAEWKHALFRLVPGVEIYEGRREILEEDLPDEIETLAEATGKRIELEVDWDSFTSSPDVQEDDRAMRNLLTCGMNPVLRPLGYGAQDSRETRALLRRKLDAVRFVRVRDAGSQGIAAEGNTLVARARILTEDGGFADFDPQDELLGVISSMPDSVAQETAEVDSSEARPIVLDLTGAVPSDPGPKGLVARFFTASAEADEPGALALLTEASREGFDLGAAPSGPMNVEIREVTDREEGAVVATTFTSEGQAQDMSFMVTEEDGEARIDFLATMKLSFGFDPTELMDQMGEALAEGMSQLGEGLAGIGEAMGESLGAVAGALAAPPEEEEEEFEEEPGPPEDRSWARDTEGLDPSPEELLELARDICRAAFPDFTPPEVEFERNETTGESSEVVLSRVGTLRRGFNVVSSRFSAGETMSTRTLAVSTFGMEGDGELNLTWTEQLMPQQEPRQLAALQVRAGPRALSSVDAIFTRHF